MNCLQLQQTQKSVSIEIFWPSVYFFCLSKNIIYSAIYNIVNVTKECLFWITLSDFEKLSKTVRKEGMQQLQPPKTITISSITCYVIDCFEKITCRYETWRSFFYQAPFCKMPEIFLWKNANISSTHCEDRTIIK